jgi:hypothetical protein
MPRRIIQSNLSFAHVPAASDKILDNNSRLRHNQRAITSEGGHTNDTQSVTYKGAHALTESHPPQPVQTLLLRHGHCPHGHRHRELPLVPETPSQCSHSPHYRKRDGIHGTDEIPPSTTTVDTRLWQQIRAPVPRHWSHSWHRHMFLYQTRQSPERQKAITNHTRGKKNESG